MAFISYTPEDEASPELSELYERYRSTGGSVDNIIRIHSQNPPSMEAHFELYRRLMQGPSPLSRAQGEMIAVTVSKLNECIY